MRRCPECHGPALVWPDNSGGVTVNFQCCNPECRSGKGPWDTEPDARLEQRDNGRWYVIYRGTVVGDHVAKYKAREQANSLNA